MKWIQANVMTYCVSKKIYKKSFEKRRATRIATSETGNHISDIIRVFIVRTEAFQGFIKCIVRTEAFQGFIRCIVRTETFKGFIK